MKKMIIIDLFILLLHIYVVIFLYKLNLHQHRKRYDIELNDCNRDTVYNIYGCSTTLIDTINWIGVQRVYDKEHKIKRTEVLIDKVHVLYVKWENDTIHKYFICPANLHLIKGFFFTTPYNDGKQHPDCYW
jgi:hypothetical protein